MAGLRQPTSIATEVISEEVDDIGSGGSGSGDGRLVAGRLLHGVSRKGKEEGEEEVQLHWIRGSGGGDFQLEIFLSKGPAPLPGGRTPGPVPVKPAPAGLPRLRGRDFTGPCQEFEGYIFAKIARRIQSLQDGANSRLLIHGFRIPL
jgi:hypothetical protein